MYVNIPIVVLNLVSAQLICDTTYVSGNDRSLGADRCIKIGVRHNFPPRTVYTGFLKESDDGKL